MNDDYKVLEFQGKVNGAIFKLRYNSNYSTDLEYNLEYSSKEMLFDKVGSVKSGGFEVIKIQKSNGEVLEIGSIINNTQSGKTYTINSFEMDFRGTGLNIVVKEGYLTIKNSYLKNPVPAQQEIKFKEPVNGYTLEDIQNVLIKVLDQPEVDAIIIDFKRLKDNNDIVVSEESKEALKEEVLSEYKDGMWPDENAIALTNTDNFIDRNNYGSSKVNYDGYPAWINKSEENMVTYQINQAEEEEEKYQQLKHIYEEQMMKHLDDRMKNDF